MRGGHGGILIDVETYPAGAVVGHDLTTGPPGWAGPIDRPVERRRRPANITKADTIAEWEASEDTRHALAVASDADTQRAEAVEHWRRGSLRWQDVRIGCIGWTVDGVPSVIDAIKMAEQMQRDGMPPAGARRWAEDTAIRALLDVAPSAGPVWTFGTYDAWVIRSRCLALGLHPGPLVTTGKPWDSRWRDLQAAYAVWLTGGREIRGISVREVAGFLGVQGLVGSGAEVTDLLLAGRWPEVIEHCRGDVAVEWELLGRLAAAGGAT